MNFKIENRIINIMNYPSAERHFENMAAKGWLISRITFESICIYKKIKPEQLEFSISPYEIESMFTKKTQDELEEFKTVCKTVGWNYATKQGDLLIYFKEAGSDAVDIQTDEEEEFKTLKQIGKKNLTGLYFQTIMFLFLSWSLLSNILSDIYIMKEGLMQITSLMIPLYSLISIKKIIETRRFIKSNDENIELGRNIEYSHSKYYSEKIVNLILIVFLVYFVIQITYAGLVLKNKIMLVTAFFSSISISIGMFFRVVIKPSKRSLNYKKRSLAIMLVASFVITTSLGVLSIGIFSTQRSNDNVEGYRSLSVNDFTDKDLEVEEGLRRNTSLLVPKSYEVTSRGRGGGYIGTEYLSAATESIAKNLVERYKKGQENQYGFNEKSITPDDENLWNADQAYFLNQEKDRIVLRKGKQVFYLEGKDFSDSRVIKISKEKLKLQ